MKKKLMAVLLTLCMAMTMFPMSALAANTADDLAVSGYGFVWNADGKTLAADSTLPGGGTVGKDWMGQTMYVVFKEAVPASTNLWFQVTVGEDVWGCAASGDGSHKTYAFSFLNRNKQWEQLPESRKEQTEATATGLADGNKATLKVFTTDSLLTAAPTADLGTALFTKEIAITSGKDVQETVAQDTPAEGALTFGEVPANTNIFGKKPADMGKFEIKQDTTKITVTGSANYIADYTEFNTAVEAEQKGHYLPIQIKGTKDQVITITNKSTGAESGKEMTFGDDGSFEMAVWLDGERAADAKKEFTVATGEGDAAVTYTVNFADVVLLPEVKTEGETTTVTPDKGIADLVTSETETSENAPVKVETSGTGSNTTKTLVFTGKDGSEGAEPTKNTTVTLDKDLVTELKDGEKKADVKVESATGSVTVPAATLGTAGANKAVTIEVKEKTVTDSDLSNETNDTLKTAIKGGKGASVIVKDEDNNLVQDVTADKAVTITINVGKSGTFYILCIKDGKVTSYGECTAVGNAVSVKTKHLTDFVAVEKTNDNAATLAAVKADPGKVVETPAVDTIPVTVDSTVAAGGIGKKVTVATENGGKYVVQVKQGNTAPAVIFQITVSGTSYEFYANVGSTVQVWKVGNTPAFTNGIPSGFTAVSEAKTV